MTCSVGGVYFSSTVHGMFEFNPIEGQEFQPNIGGPGELLNLETVARYYSFPEYKYRNGAFGFIGIEVLNPTLVLDSGLF